MAELSPFYVTTAVEGPLDEVILRRIANAAGVGIAYVYGKKGRDDLNANLNRYNQTAFFDPWVVLRDLDHDAPCAAELRLLLLPSPAPRMRLRIAVREAEAWLLADRERFSGFFKVSVANLPHDLEMQRQVGPAYISLMSEFVNDHANGWRPAIAAASSDSLRRCIARLTELVTKSLTQEET
ncbi:MAG: hypothetical protein NTZ05_08160 [Chloroflexi bacterium]|nr:hypothetical protein [Chloroflexota bacterium]